MQESQPLGISLYNVDFLNKNASSIHEFKVDNGGKLYREQSDWISWVVEKITGETAKRVRRTIEQSLQDLNDHRQSFNETITDSEIVVLIKDRLVPARERFSSFCIYKKNHLQNLIVKELGECRSEKENEDVMSKAMAKAQLMFTLGIGLHHNKGASGSIRISWFKKRVIGIFKPEPKDGLIELMIQRVKYYTGMQESHLNTARMARPEAEVAAYVIDQYLGLGITCPTRRVTFGGMRGSFQLFARGMREAKEIMDLLETRSYFHDDDIEKFQQMAIFDYLLGDLDGHDENWLINDGKEGRLIGVIYKIDNANSFIESNPKRFIGTDNKQYQWARLRIAENKFCSKARELMRSLDEQKIDGIVGELRDKVPVFVSEDMIALLKQRARVLVKIAGIDCATPQLIGYLRTNEEILSFLEKKDVESLDESDFINLDDNFSEQEENREEKKTVPEITASSRDEFGI